MIKFIKAILWFSAISSFPAYGMDESQENKQPNKKIYSKLQRQIENQSSLFSNIPPNKLPIPLAKEMFSYLDIKALKNASLSCKYFNELATGLFEEIWNSPKKFVSSNWSEASPQ